MLKVWCFTCSRLNDASIVWYDVVTWVERWTYESVLSIGCGSHRVIGIHFSVLIYRAGEEQGCGTMHRTIMVSADLCRSYIYLFLIFLVSNACLFLLPAIFSQQFIDAFLCHAGTRDGWPVGIVFSADLDC